MKYAHVVCILISLLLSSCLGEQPFSSAPSSTDSGSTPPTTNTETIYKIFPGTTTCVSFDSGLFKCVNLNTSAITTRQFSSKVKNYLSLALGFVFLEDGQLIEHSSVKPLTSLCSKLGQKIDHIKPSKGPFLVSKVTGYPPFSTNTKANLFGWLFIL